MLKKNQIMMIGTYIFLDSLEWAISCQIVTKKSTFLVTLTATTNDAVWKNEGLGSYAYPVWDNPMDSVELIICNIVTHWKLCSCQKLKLIMLWKVYNPT